MNFKCACCDEMIEGVPTFGWNFPIAYLDVPEEKRNEVYLTEDLCAIENLCVIGDEHFFIKGCIDIPVIGHDDSFMWGVWVKVSEDDFYEYQDLLGVEKRSGHGPYSGYLSAYIDLYPPIENLKVIMHIRDNGTRPYIEIKAKEHPLTIEQQNGITLVRVGEIYASKAHSNKT